MVYFKQITAIILIALLLCFVFPGAARAELQAAVEYQKLNGEEAVNTMKIDWWVARQIGLRGTVDFGDTGISADLLYRKKDQERITPYLGLGLRDLFNHNGKRLDTDERLELIAGIELALTKKLSLAAETRFVPLNHDDHPEMKPVLGISFKWVVGEIFGASEAAEQVGNEAVLLLAKLITAEAGLEPYEGQVAVGAVVMNRTKSGTFPTTIKEVIYQEGQFSCLPKLPATQPSLAALRAAREAIAGVDPSQGALFYYNPVICKPEALPFFESPKLTVTTRIGQHVFLKPKVVPVKK
ncbi:MAG TPA: cell wall hydrolase [Bacillota bacterium]|nr:cell wall hydrolase [Bacillota bacterium]